MVAMAKHFKNHLWVSTFGFILFSFLSYSSAQQDGCNYVIKTQTADLKGAGTSGKVRLSLCTGDDNCFLVLPDLAQYGERGPRYEHYFQQGRYSYFSLKTRASCSSTCKVIIGHDGGKKDNWMVDFVEVEALSTYGSRQFNNLFPVYESLKAGQQIIVNRCMQDTGCNYEAWVRTGDQWNASTYGNVSLALSDKEGQSFIDIDNLAQYGVKGPLVGTYFTKRSHSLFIIPTEAEVCNNPCKASVTHNGEGWFLDSIIVNIYNGNNFQYKEPFKFEQWVETDQIATVDNCQKYYYDEDKKVENLGSQGLHELHAAA